MSPELPEALQVALRVIDALEAMGIQYHLGGSYASSIHGIPRQTQDVDLVVDVTPDSASALAQRLSGEFYADARSAHEAAREKRSFNFIHLDSGIKVDFFVLAAAPFDKEEFQRHRRERVQVGPERFAYVKSPEDIILRKLQWYRMGGEVSDRQWADVVGIVLTQGEAVNREYLRRWARELGVEDLLKRVLKRSP